MIVSTRVFTIAARQLAGSVQNHGAAGIARGVDQAAGLAIRDWRSLHTAPVQLVGD